MGITVKLFNIYNKYPLYKMSSNIGGKHVKIITSTLRKAIESGVYVYMCMYNFL